MTWGGQGHHYIAGYVERAAALDGEVVGPRLDQPGRDVDDGIGRNRRADDGFPVRVGQVVESEEFGVVDGLRAVGASAVRERHAARDIDVARKRNGDLEHVCDGRTVDDGAQAGDRVVRDDIAGRMLHEHDFRRTECRHRQVVVQRRRRNAAPAGREHDCRARSRNLGGFPVFRVAEARSVAGARPQAGTPQPLDEMQIHPADVADRTLCLPVGGAFVLYRDDFVVHHLVAIGRKHHVAAGLEVEDIDAGGIRAGGVPYAVRPDGKDRVVAER